MGRHEPVLVARVLECLQPRRGGLFVDCTFGLGGHTRALLEAGPARVIGLDRDAEALALGREALGALADRVTLVHADFRQLGAILDRQGVADVRGVLVDLGMSSYQLEQPGRGFSFRRDDPLDMRMDRSIGATAAEWLREVDEASLADVIARYGEERHARRVAGAIVRARADAPIETTGQLAAIVRRAVPRSRGHRIDPATRTFQAIRIRVNTEIEELPEFIVEAATRLSPGGRLAIISFHSIEDRAVKQAFRALASTAGYGLVTRKPLRPDPAERERNPRSRSAKLRVLEAFS